MIAYKLCRKKKNGKITSLFINKKEELPFHEWIEAKEYPTKGFALRPFWHCTEKCEAPHLTTRGRVWIKVEMAEFTEMMRPQSQGGKWFLARKIKLLEEIPEKNEIN